MADIVDILRSVAPTLGAAMEGPLAGIAVKYIAEKLDGMEIPAGRDHQSVIQDLLSDTTKLNTVKEIDQQFKEEMQKLNVDVFALKVNDRESLQSRAHKDMPVQAAISLFFIVAYFGILAWVFYAEVSSTMQPGMYFNQAKGEWVRFEESLIDVFQVLLGVLTAGVGQILNFWFGGILGRRESSDANGHHRHGSS